MRKLYGRTEQSIYKRLSKPNNQLKVFSKETKEGLKIHKDALSVIYKIEQKFENKVEQPSLTTPSIQEKEKETTEETHTAETKVIDILTKELEEQRKSNEIKDQQIRELTEMLQNSQRMLDQEQKLNAMNTTRILQLEQGTKEKQRKSIFDLFKRKVVE